nr:hypothetical protein GCM10025699_06120 [Microbacterium flavescens]
MTTRNTTPARVDQLVIADPAPTTIVDRRQDPFQAFTFNNFSAITVPSGTTSTVVRLFCPGGQAPEDYTVAQALALVPAALPCDVTGIQVSFDGRIAANGAGVVAFDVRLRPYWRGTTERVSVADSPIANTAQGVVADIEPTGPCPRRRTPATRATSRPPSSSSRSRPSPSRRASRSLRRPRRTETPVRSP